jgi:DNA-binding transcriptional regulator YdaS (Cro superfamily)
MITESEKEALREAINIVGGQSALARMFGVTQQAVNQWLENGLPYNRVIPLEKATSRKRQKVSRYKLKPSLFNSEL